MYVSSRILRGFVSGPTYKYQMSRINKLHACLSFFSYFIVFFFLFVFFFSYMSWKISIVFWIWVISFREFSIETYMNIHICLLFYIDLNFYAFAIIVYRHLNILVKLFQVEKFHLYHEKVYDTHQEFLKISCENNRK